MKRALKTHPKPALAIVPKPSPPILLNDAETAALYLAEIMPPAMRLELGRLLLIA